MAAAIISFFEALGWRTAAVAALLAVIPVTEIKGAVLYAAATEGSCLIAVVAAYLSSVLLAVLLAAAVPRTLALARKAPSIRRATGFLTERLSVRADRIAAAAERKGKGDGSRLFGVFAFVAIPLPLTGLWAGALLAALLGLKPKSTFFALAAGNFTAAGIVLAVALLAGERAGLVFDVFLYIALAILLCTVAKSLFTRHRARAKVR